MYILMNRFRWRRRIAAVPGTSCVDCHSDFTSSTRSASFFTLRNSQYTEMFTCFTFTFSIHDDTGYFIVISVCRYFRFRCVDQHNVLCKLHLPQRYSLTTIWYTNTKSIRQRLPLFTSTNFGHQHLWLSVLQPVCSPRLATTQSPDIRWKKHIVGTYRTQRIEVLNLCWNDQYS